MLAELSVMITFIIVKLELDKESKKLANHELEPIGRKENIFVCSKY
jgi:hypothetical protein